MEHSPRTPEEIQARLREKAEKQFGKPRADELAADIMQTSVDLSQIFSHSVGLEDEL